MSNLKKISYLICIFIFSCGSPKASQQPKEDKSASKNNMNFHQFIPAYPNNKSLGQRILILDSEKKPVFKSSFYKNKEKILAYYSFLEKKLTYKEFLPQIIAPKELDDVFSKKTRKGPKELLKLHHKIRLIQPKTKEISHGEDIFLILAELNPDSQFVFATFPELTAHSFCNTKKEKHIISRHYQNAQEQLSKIIRRHQINFVNISYSTTIENLEKHNKNICNGLLSKNELNFILQKKNNFLDKLSLRHPQVVFFSALPNYAKEKAPCTHGGYKFSCAQRSNFIRVSYQENYPEKIEKAGSIFNTKAINPQNDQIKFIECTDIIINTRVSLDKKRQQYSFYIPIEGIYKDYVDIMSNSYATPLALSFYLYIKKIKSFKISNYLFRAFAKNKIFDPFIYQHFNKYWGKK